MKDNNIHNNIFCPDINLENVNNIIKNHYKSLYSKDCAAYIVFSLSQHGSFYAFDVKSIIKLYKSEVNKDIKQTNLLRGFVCLNNKNIPLINLHYLLQKYQNLTQDCDIVTVDRNINESNKLLTLFVQVNQDIYAFLIQKAYEIAYIDTANINFLTEKYLKNIHSLIYATLDLKDKKTVKFINVEKIIAIFLQAENYTE